MRIEVSSRRGPGDLGLNKPSPRLCPARSAPDAGSLGRIWGCGLPPCMSSSTTSAVGRAQAELSSRHIMSQYFVDVHVCVLTLCMYVCVCVCVYISFLLVISTFPFRS